MVLLVGRSKSVGSDYDKITLTECAMAQEIRRNADYSGVAIKTPVKATDGSHARIKAILWPTRKPSFGNGGILAVCSGCDREAIGSSRALVT